MSDPTRTLSWILPFVRKAMKGVGNTSYPRFLPAVWAEMEKANVPKVERVPPHQSHLGQLFMYEHAPFELKALTVEAFYYLFHNGYIAPNPPDSSLNIYLNDYVVTQRGREWFSGAEPFPEEAEGYMLFLRQLVPGADPTIEQYVVESLTAFERRAYFASAVMLGAASEKALYRLAESMLGAFKDTRRASKLQTLLDRRKLGELFEFVKNAIESANALKVLPYAQFEGSSTHLMSLIEAIRVQRNDAVHPMNAVVSPDSVRLSIMSFPHALRKCEELRDWLTVNPNSI